jgi:hypothetical protein
MYNTGKTKKRYRSVKKISEFLIKFKNLKPPGELVEKELKDIISDTINIPKDCFEVSFNKPNIVISSDISALKNEVYINKDKITKNLKDKLGEGCFKEVMYK